ncbi:MAG TPA: outer membrane beta-barrel protein, partial [Gammaproteobacteria bacterium]|nr:outer membrane beta-barrel protein [Gammaproteobacteria bacterium]
KRHPAFFFKAMLSTFLLLLPFFALAETANYKGEAAAPPRKIYKDEVASNDFASAYVPKEGKYGGQVYTSELYQGPLEGPGYSPSGTRSLHDGFYMGAQIGYDSYKMRSNINTVAFGVSVFQQSPELNAVGLSYTALAGFGKVFDDPLYLGFELFYNDSQANTTQNIGIFNSNNNIYYIKSVILNSYGFDLTPGIKLGESVLLFLKAGYSRMDAKTYETSAALNINNAESNGSNGFNIGLGLEADIYKNWSIRGEYTHTNFQQFTTSLGTGITPANNQFMFGVVLHFI